VAGIAINILIGYTYCNTIYWWSQILQSIY
jgi:hypothetical protein